MLLKAQGLVTALGRMQGIKLGCKLIVVSKDPLYVAAQNGKLRKKQVGSEGR
jgi:hypothetical protein